jgi:eukaryotic-like serine/threonine-protein kinase
MSLSSGTKLGPYEIVAPIGAGGMGEVYRAKDTRLGRDVAIQVLPEVLVKDADRLRRFELEARAVAALNHPNILGIHHIGSYEGAPFLVSELLDGGTLREKIDAGAPG